MSSTSLLVALTRGNPSSGVSPPRPLRIGLLGCGVVGRGFAELVLSRKDTEIVAALVRDADRARGPALDGAARVTDIDAFLATRPDVVVEALPAAEPAGAIVAALLRRGLPVVTANKALLAERGRELADLARAHGAALRFEASVASGIPLFALLERSLRTTEITSVTGILNGTSNFVLSRLARGAPSVADALAEARRLGLAEPDTSADLGGADAARKLRVLAFALTGRELAAPQVDVSGIEHVRAADASRAAALGYRLRPVASVRFDVPAPRGFVGPCAVPDDHPLARVDGADNGVLLTGEPIGALFLSGPGAGPGPTAAALLDDVLAIAEGGPAASHRPRTQAAPAPDAHAPCEPRWLVTASPAPRGPDADAVLAFLAKAGLPFRTLRELDEPGGPVLAGVTAPAPADRVERLATSLRTVGAVRDVRAFRVLDGVRAQ